MLTIITGASGSGKSACLPYLKAALPEVDVVDFDDIGVPENADKIWRQESTEKWLQHYLAQNKPMVICGQMVAGEIMACPSFPQIGEMRVCLLDCSDVERIKRLHARGTYGVNQDTLNWAAWLRMHHASPAWQAHVIKEGAWEGLNFSHLELLNTWDSLLPSIRILDTSYKSIEYVALELGGWIECKSLEELIHQRELSLLDSYVRQSPEKLNELIADNFIEFGSSGKVFTKQEILESLPFETQQEFIVEDFAIRELSKNAVLATYKVKTGSVWSLRSSIWRLNRTHWQMVFHQGTKCKS